MVRYSNDKVYKEEKDTILSKQIVKKLDDVIAKENELFFKLRDIIFPRSVSLSKINNHLFRKELGLEMTKDIIRAYQQLVPLDSIAKEFNYTKHQNEYLTARARHIIDYKVDSGDSLINQILKLDLLGRFMSEQTLQLEKEKSM